MTSCESPITFSLLAPKSRAIRSPRMSASYSAILLLAEKSSWATAGRTIPSRVRSVAPILTPCEFSAPLKWRVHSQTSGMTLLITSISWFGKSVDTG